MTPREYRGNKETIPGEKRARKLITDPARADAGEDAHPSETCSDLPALCSLSGQGHHRGDRTRALTGAGGQLGPGGGDGAEKETERG